MLRSRISNLEKAAQQFAGGKSCPFCPPPLFTINGEREAGEDGNPDEPSHCPHCGNERGVVDFVFPGMKGSQHD